MRGLRIVQVCADRGIVPGSTKGAAQHLRGIASGLIVLGHEVRYYSARQGEGVFPVEVRPLADLDNESEGRVDVVYERYSLGHRGGLDLARSVGALFVLEVNAPLVEEARSHRPNTVEPHHPDVEAALLEQSDLVITVSSELNDWVRERRLGPSVVIPNGFEPSWFPSPARGNGPPTLVFLGHPKPWHGATRLPSLLVALSDLGHQPDLFVIGGGLGAVELETQAQSLGVDDQVTITGPLPPDQASALLQTASIGLAPYPRQHPFYFCPLKIIDYLAAGLPVVATNQGDIEAMVHDAGLVVDADDEDAFVEAVRYLLDNPELGVEMGLRGRSRAMESMTWGHVANRTIQSIEPLLAGSVAP